MILKKCWQESSNRYFRTNVTTMEGVPLVRKYCESEKVSMVPMELDIVASCTFLS